MAPEYDFKAVEQRWQAAWEKKDAFRADPASPKPKCYVLSMWPYPSGVLHMGHVINYTIGDVVVRYKKLRGYEVLSPMGWDSFGLPAENAAIRTGVHPHDFTEKNIAHMRAQMKRAGWAYDWSREIATSHPDYYKWTQWLFLQFFKHGHAVKKSAPVNWCESCATVLANEQVMGDGTCERCGTTVEQKDMSQWFFTMSAYAQRLLDGHESLRGKWPDAVLAMQEEWIGRSVGARVRFTVKETGEPLDVFTTRPDTLWGVTFLSLAPEHPLIEKLLKGASQEAAVMAEVRRLRTGSVSEKDFAEREKEGVATGFHVVNPVNGEAVPLWVANFALMGYGTGAVMAVPAHDQRDWEFAKKYDLPVVKVIDPPDGSGPERWTAAYVDKGAMVASGPFTGRPDNQAAIPDVVAWLAKEGRGEARVNYRLHDWLLSRQRYWGAPIPVVYCDACGIVPVPEKDLPVLLPTDVPFRQGQGNPLARAEAFVNCACPACGRPARRETDTMDTFVDSSWYFLRFADPHNENEAWDRKLLDHWSAVDHYIGGIEHATMHLIYARYFTMVLRDLGLVGFDEPFTRLFCQGMVCKTAYRCENDKWLPESDVEAVEDGGGTRYVCKRCGGPVAAEMAKISKSKLNIVDPDAMMDAYGADTVRLYMLSDSPPDRMQVWSEAGINGAWRTLTRLWALLSESVERAAPAGAPAPSDLDAASRAMRRKTHQVIARVTEAIEGGFQFNTAIARMNELLNQFRADRDKLHPWVVREALETVLRMLSPITPHFCEEAWRQFGHAEGIFTQPWPEADPGLMKEDTVEIPVQINGKVRAKLTLAADATKEAMEKAALAHEKIAPQLAGRTLVKVVAVPGRMVNVVLGGPKES